ncbi:MAG: DNA recombination protein RmuC [Gammaproteobacteria bacterium]|nr:DNA recombination protein RmuC [Gammaproteobacteria bacterium]
MIFAICLLVALLITTVIVLFVQRMGHHFKESVLEKLNELRTHQQQALSEHRTTFDERQFDSLKILQDTLLKGVQDTRFSVKEALHDYSEQLGKRVETLTQTTDNRLKEINEQVEKRLTAGFEKTTETFSDVVKRLALIDAAQKQISELSDNVVDLQGILNDKRSRGAFGEVQLSALIRNVMPEQHFSFQHTLSNGKRADCILFLPNPSGNIVIDAKFPLESFRLLTESSPSSVERSQIETQFKKDIRKHIQDIAEKYIIPGETADGAMMFIPAEAIFAEIHARHPDIVEAANRAKVWLVSPTTMMAILNTARAVLKDTATRKQLNIIQDHLRLLANDFKRFQKRMDDVAHHIAKAHNEVDQVHISSKKITTRFGQIEKVELDIISAEAVTEDLALTNAESMES